MSQMTDEIRYLSKTLKRKNRIEKDDSFEAEVFTDKAQFILCF